MELVGLGREPCAIPIGQHGIEDHQALHGTREGCRFAVTIVWFANGGVQPFAVDVVEPRGVVPAGLGRAEAAGDDTLEKVVHLPAIGYAGEGAVVATEAHTRVQHHGDEKRGLALREPRRRSPPGHVRRTSRELLGEIRIARRARRDRTGRPPVRRPSDNS
jgi:hypothetical protein